MSGRPRLWAVAVEPEQLWVGRAGVCGDALRSRLPSLFSLKWARVLCQVHTAGTLQAGWSPWAEPPPSGEGGDADLGAHRPPELGSSCSSQPYLCAGHSPVCCPESVPCRSDLCAGSSCQVVCKATWTWAGTSSPRGTNRHFWCLPASIAAWRPGECVRMLCSRFLVGRPKACSDAARRGDPVGQ